MKKLCIAAFGNPSDPTVWSGTSSSIVKYFDKSDEYEITQYDLKKMSGKIYRLFSLLGRVIYRRGTLRDPFLYRIESERVVKSTYEVNPDVYLFVAEHTLNKKKNHNAKYYVYLDSLLRPYFIYDMRKRKLFSKSFLKGYEANDKKCFVEYDGIMTLNQWSKDFLIQEYGISENKIYNIGFGINTNFNDGKKDYTKKQLMIVLRRGTEYIKGLYLLVNAFKMVKAKIPEIKLAVFGTKYEEVDGITYYENCDRQLMLDMYKESTLYVMPNVLEPNGITYLEALASRTPIIGLDRFAVPEFAGYGEYGFIVSDETADSLAETIEIALSNPKLLNEMGKKGQEFVKNRYDWNIVLKKMNDIISQE